jgi:hypothetical protein
MTFATADDLASLDPEALADLDALIVAESEAPAAAFWLDPPGVGLWGMADWQREIVNDPSPRVFLRKGNKVGGSAILSWAIRAFLGGFHPSPAWQRPRRRATVLYVAADLDSSYKTDVSPRLREFFPDCDLSDRCMYDPIRGFVVAGGRGLETRDGDQIIFRSGTQTALAVAGTSVDAVVMNEPPRQHIWSEALRAAAEHMAPVLVNFTPLPPESLVGGDNLKWCRAEIEKPDGGWSEHVVPLRYDTAPHRTRESVDRQIADMLAWERAQRRDAQWDGPAPDRMLDGFSDAIVSDTVAFAGEVAVRLGFDHGERPGAEFCLLAYQWEERDGVCLHVWDEYESQGRTTEQQDALRIEAMLGRHDLELLNVDDAVGDVNSAGKSRAGTSVNEEFEAAFALLSGLGRPPFRIAKPSKGKGSVLKAVRIVNAAMLHGRLKIHPRCVRLLESVARWNGRDNDHKHAVDALLYLAGRISPGHRRANQALPIRVS